MKPTNGCIHILNMSAHFSQKTAGLLLCYKWKTSFLQTLTKLMLTGLENWQINSKPIYLGQCAMELMQITRLKPVTVAIVPILLKAWFHNLNLQFEQKMNNGLIDLVKVKPFVQLEIQGEVLRHSLQLEEVCIIITCFMEERCGEIGVR